MSALSKVQERQANEELERQARALREDKKALRTRILQARAVLTKEYRALFQSYTFDFDNACIWTGDKRYRLQWQVRNYPSIPPFYLNQQTNRGTVCLVQEF